ncbi:hypothetical protein [Chthonobacter rhizosphaerae]|uniref:hypothetical protein n=1 Tax=Chthonobacter rhizosphaerae TaxID=2735553 RepID=UPI0015EEFB3D|nr:hypothetical protein [Chthonobacter rhizosphaerae]
MERGTGGLTTGQRERVEYIERMSQELSRMADGAGLKVLAYLLEMAREEAAAAIGDRPALQVVPKAPTVKVRPRIPPPMED